MPIPNDPNYSHGSSGDEPSSRDYENGDPLDANHFDYFVNTLFTKVKQIITALEEIENGTIEVSNAQHADEADNTQTVQGNDIFAQSSQKVYHSQNADDADTLDGMEIYVQDSEPSNPNNGDLWVDTS